MTRDRPSVQAGKPENDWICREYKVDYIDKEDGIWSSDLGMTVMRGLVCQSRLTRPSDEG